MVCIFHQRTLSHSGAVDQDINAAENTESGAGFMGQFICMGDIEGKDARTGLSLALSLNTLQFVFTARGENQSCACLMKSQRQGFTNARRCPGNPDAAL